MSTLDETAAGLAMDLLGYETGAPPLRRIAAGGRTVAYRESGYDNPHTVVLLHGVSSLAASWGPQFVSLPSQGLRLIAWDAPGYGGSDALLRPDPSPQDYAEVLRDFVDALGLTQFDLIGHSFGALPAAAFCRLTGSARVRKLILASPTPGYATAEAELRTLRIDGRLRDMAALGPAAMAQQRAAQVMSPQAPPRALMLIKAVMQQMRPDGYAQAVRMLGRGDIIAEGKGITVPTLVMCGSADTVTPEASCRRIAAAVPGARFELVPGPGHALYIESPGTFDAAVLRFLKAA
jgi:pimeloyl-ACP methyl ester carboxylesterase